MIYEARSLAKRLKFVTPFFLHKIASSNTCENIFRTLFEGIVQLEKHF